MTKKVIDIIEWIIILTLSVFLYVQCENKKTIDEKIVYVEKNGVYNEIYDSQKLSSLEKENKQLYDSIKKLKNVESVVQFKYIKEYVTDTVFTDTLYMDISKRDSTINVYEYARSNDTIDYKLLIGAEKEPKWYNINFKVNDKLTIINREMGGQNHLTIGSGNKAEIDDVTVFHRQNKTFWKRFRVGPSVTAGYDMINKNYGITVGVGVTFDLTK